MLYLWLKAIHVFFVISWFAGLFYLPRIFVNLAQVPEAGAERARLLGMALRLKRFMLPLMIGTWLFGLAVIFSNGMESASVWFHQGWLHAKLLLVLVLTGYDGYCKHLLRDFQNGRNSKSHVWFRWFNEIPAALLLIILILVIIKPF
ncbi:CopD family protein [Uliginosibacterium sediminicola]|uniref:Protoporphyrinogen IX oxidase n=1 Tax=Uliginosibacterium sediminicola TaxID=2024550 RepID=A0ABU9YXL4_9RHOO